MRQYLICICSVLFFFTLYNATGDEVSAEIEQYKKRYKGKFLYTKPEPSSPGGIKGRIIKPEKPVVAIFALPPGEPRFVYKGIILNKGEKQSEFSFNGLPSDKYDIFIVFNDMIYNGLNLNRGETTLTKRDKALIQKTISKSEPFFDKKKIYRLEGKTGKMEGKARCICIYLRTKKMMDEMGIWYYSHRRAIKLVLLEDIGPGWQIARTREIYTTFVSRNGQKDYPLIVYRKYLGRIRVTDKIKDLGDIDLRLEKNPRK